MTVIQFCFCRKTKPETACSANFREMTAFELLLSDNLLVSY